MIDSVIAADWSYTPANRWYAKACRTGEQTFEVHPATLVPRATTFLADLCAESKGGSILAGFDFPIGVPSIYAQKTGIASFRQFLQDLAEGRRTGFLEPGNEPSLDCPFYPDSQGPGKHGAILSTALGVTSLDQMLRLCDLKTDERGKAECIFFTMGPKQVGKAAISGWRDILIPKLKDILLWPFDGDLEDLIPHGKPIITEIYPAEAYRHLGFRLQGKKADVDTRRAVADTILAAECENIHFASEAERQIRDGFNNDNAFDAMVSLISMLQVVTGQRQTDAPSTPVVRNIEGWIFGQAGHLPHYSGDKAIIRNLKTGQEPILKGRRPTGKTLMDFWRWSSSDLVCNAMRGVLAEYLVACDLGVDDGLRVEWDTQDIVTKTGIKVEVKSAAYCQSWAQQRPSKIQFGIAPAMAYDYETCKYTDEVRRHADVYVFCILAHRDVATLNPLDTDQWEFYVLPATVLDRHSPIQKSISLSTLFALRPTKARYGEIGLVINRLAAAKPLGPSSDAP